MLKKLRLKFVLVNMLIVTCMLLVIMGLIFQQTKANLDMKTNNALQMLTQGSQLPETADVQLPYFILQVSIHGNVSISGRSYHDLLDEAFIQELIQYVYTAEETEGVIPKYDLRYRFVPGIFSHKLIFVDISGHTAALKSLMQGCVLVGIVALVAFFGISILLARWAVSPVEKAWRQQQRFISDASHELKTPLTVIMSNAELLQNPEFDSGDKEKFTGSILTMTKQMRNLVEGMLELARADNGQVKKTFEKLDFSKEIEEILLPFEPVFFEKGLILQSDIEKDIILNGSRNYLRQVLEILLDNAVKYSEAGVVAVRFHRQGRNHCLLTVSNPGVPIPQEALKRIFDRFYRVDEARGRTGSFGLGLPIAKTVIEEHQGRIWAESNETGNRFCVLLPCNSIN